MAFYDLNLSSSSAGAASVREQAAMALRLGWDTVAIVHRAEDRLLDKDRCTLHLVPLEDLQSAAMQAGPTLRVTRSLLRNPSGKGRRKQTIADQCNQTAATQGGNAQQSKHASAARLAADVDNNQHLAKSAGNGALLNVSEATQSIQQLTRLTFTTADASFAAQLDQRSDLTSQYDVIAIYPTSERVMQQACMSLPVDLITFNFAKRLPFRFKPTLLDTAIARGVYFEICYTALHDDNARREFFANAQMLTRTTRGRGIVISSGSSRACHLRGPSDVANIATFLGLSQEQGKAAISSAPAAVVQHGVTRRAAHGAALLQHHPTAALRPSETARSQRGNASSASVQAVSQSAATQHNSASAQQVSEHMTWSPAAAQLACRPLVSSHSPVQEGPTPLRAGKQRMGARGNIQEADKKLNTSSPQSQQLRQESTKKRKRNKKKVSVD